MSLSRIKSSLVCAMVLAGLTSNLCVRADDPGTVPKSDAVKSNEGTPSKNDAAPGTGKGENLLPPPKFRLVPNKNGEMIAIPKGRTFEDIDKAFEELRNRPKGPQAATISQVEIEGEASDERANLKVTFTIQLHQDEQFESVPLFFNDAVLMKLPIHSGDSKDKEFEQEPRKDPKLGYICWLRGRGQHRLEYQFGVPLRKSLPSRHLSVMLPPSPITRLKLTLPYPSVSAKVLSEQAIFEVKQAGAQASLIEAFGFGPQLDLTWQPNLDIRTNDVSLESQIAIRVQIEAEQVLLQADQKISSLQGREQFIVKLPTNSELIKLDDAERQSFKIDPDNPQNVIITLKEKANSAQLKWTLLLPGKVGAPLTIDGFSVEGARKQVGKIGFWFAQGLRLSKAADPTLLSINAGEFPSSMGPVAHAYQFFNQPFKVTTVIDEVRPYFEVKPKLLLTTSSQNLTLDADFEFHVDRDSMNRDSLNEVVLTWPLLKSEGWVIESVNNPGVVENYTVDDSGQIAVRLTKYRSGKFSIRMRARRKFKLGDEVSFSMPRPKFASRLTPTTLVLANVENVETDLTARGETVLHQLPHTSPEIGTLPEAARGLKTTVFRVDTDEQAFGLRVIPQKQRLRTDSLTEAKWQDNQFRIVQHIKYDVQYERLSQVRVSAPAGIDIDRVRFFARETEIIPEFLQTDSGRQIQLKLGEAQLGQFEIQARFSIPFAKDSLFDPDAIVAFPIFASLDEPFLQTRFSLAVSDWFDAEPMSVETWKPQLNRQDALLWLAEGVPDELRLKLVRSTHANEMGIVSRALIRIQINGPGDGAVRAQFRISTRATLLPVVLPESSRPAIFYWDQRRLSQRECVESPVGSRRYLLQLPEQRDDSSQSMHLLTVDYQDVFSSVLGWSDRLELRAPQLLNCSWVQVYWQVVLPSEQHLLTYPRAASPMFYWQRTGFVFGRVSTHSSETLQHWVVKDVATAAPSPDFMFSDLNGNSYTFSQFDSPKALVFQTLSSPMVLLIGAGFSLAVGFVMLRLVFLRHVMTLLLVSLIVAILGLWFAEPLELLIQPMIAGLVFPVAAVLLEGWIRRRYDPGVIPFEGQGEFPPIHAFGSHYMIRQADPNEATMPRAIARDSDPGVALETGSGVS